VPPRCSTGSLSLPDPVTPPCYYGSTRPSWVGWSFLFLHHSPVGLFPSVVGPSILLTGPLPK
jgi:hypothetical protein